MQVYLVITSDTRNTVKDSYGVIESYLFTDIDSAKIKLFELFKYANNQENVDEEETSYFDGVDFDVFYKSGGVYYGKIEKHYI